MIWYIHEIERPHVSDIICKRAQEVQGDLLKWVM